MADPSRVCRRHFSSGEGPDRCLLCELEVQYGLTRFDCDDCDGNFGSEHALMQHRNSAVHDAHRCGSCNRVFGSAAALQQHVDSGIHRPSRFECVVCNRSFGSVQALNQHRSSASHLSYQCEECSRSFSTTEGLAQHWNSRHQNRRCEDCEVTFDRIHDLIWHTCVYRPETWDDEDEEYRCHDCDSVFSSLLSLQMHQDGEEPPEETDPLRFECSLCDREFGSQHSLDQHTADSPVHRRRQFRCLECNLGFLSGDALEEHRNDAWLHPRDYSPPRSPIRGSGRVLPDMDLLTLRAGAVSLAVPTQSSFSQPFNVADMSDFSDEESFYNYQTYGYPTNFGTTTSPSTAESAGSTGQAGSTSNQGVNPSRNLDPSTVTKPATEDPKTDPVVLDSEPAPCEPSDPEQQLKAEREKVAALTRDLLAAREALKKEKLHRQCGMCYEKPTDTVTKCGHLFCGGCIANWQRQHDHPFQAPCPMCRKAMGKTIKIYTD